MNTKGLPVASLIFAVYADVFLIFGDPDCRKNLLMNISLIQVTQLWLYAAYCNLSSYTINEGISKMRRSFTDQPVFQSIGNILQ